MSTRTMKQCVTTHNLQARSLTMRLTGQSSRGFSRHSGKLYWETQTESVGKSMTYYSKSTSKDQWQLLPIPPSTDSLQQSSPATCWATSKSWAATFRSRGMTSLSLVCSPAKLSRTCHSTMSYSCSRTSFSFTSTGTSRSSKINSVSTTMWSTTCSSFSQGWVSTGAGTLMFRH